MNWVGFWSIYGLATIKFMVSTLPGPRFELTFFQTWLAAFLGAATASAFFFYGSELVMLISHRQRAKNRAKALAQGKEPRNYSRVTKLKRRIITIKTKMGFYGISLFGPLLFSVPIGSYVVAKFYGKFPSAFLFVLIGLAANAFLLTFLSYAVF